MIKLSKSVQNLKGQPMFQILAKAQELERQGRKLIHFELGEPDFNTSLPIKIQTISSILKNDTKYTSSSGLHDLKAAACAITLKSRGFEPDINQVLVTPGANIQIYLALSCLCNPGDEVLIFAPYFPSYVSQCVALGIKPIIVETHKCFNFNPLQSDFESKITKKTKAVIINSPCNPTGYILNKFEYTNLYNILNKYNIAIISDEVYARLTFGDSKFFSPSSFDSCKEKVIVVNGFSKSYAMTGWRLGVCTGPQKMIEKMTLLQETILSCVPPFIQRAGIEALKYRNESMINEFAYRSVLATDLLNKTVGCWRGDISCLYPDGGLYCWFDVSKTTNLTSQQFCDEALDLGVVLTPGTVFGVENYVRLCFANSRENIVKGIKLLERI
jgi:aspartate aminotransferase